MRLFPKTKNRTKQGPDVVVMYECATCLRMPEIYVTGLEAVTGTLVVNASYS